MKNNHTIDTPVDDHVVSRKADRYMAVLKHMFGDLLDLSKSWDRRVLDRLYYNRERDIQKLHECLLGFRRSRRNILVTGDAGVGKSTYIYKCLLDPSAPEKFSMYPIFVDYRTLFNKEALKKRFLADLLKYFEFIEYPCLAQNVTEATINDVKSTALAHLSQVPIRERDLAFPVVFLDDFDYIENELFPFLEWFIGFAASENCCVILSARPPLYASANTVDNRYANYLTRHVERIKLKPVTPYKLIAHRMALLLKRDEGHAYLDRLRTWWQYRKDPFRAWLKDEGFENLEDLEESLHLPFSEGFCNFMSATTNGNIREMLQIALASLRHILHNYEALDKVVEDYNGSPQERCLLSENEIFDLFGGEAKEGEGSYRIVNLHEYRAKKTSAPLLFNALEAIEHFEIFNPSLTAAMNSLGHKKKEINWAIDYLQGKAVRMISPKGLYPDGERAELYPRFELTEKGKFYLIHLSCWPSYVDAFAFGDKGRSLLDVVVS